MSNTLVPAIRTQFAHTHALRPSHTRANTQATHTRRVELVIHTALTRIRQFLIHVLFLFLSFYSLSLEYSFFFFFWRSYNRMARKFSFPTLICDVRRLFEAYTPPSLD